MSVDYFVELSTRMKEQGPDLRKADEVTMRYHLLLISGKRDDKKAADELRSEWDATLAEQPTDAVWQMIAKPEPDLSTLPLCSFFLSFTFKLAKPYISKDDNPFHIIDNPIVRDKVFRLPLVRPTSWKGNLYSALWQLGHNKQNDEQMQRLFGETRGEESGQAGHLYFYPTFFAQTGLDIINPHNRKRRVGKNPILFESVPQGAQGTFTLLYAPLDRIGQDEAETRRQAAEDLQLVAEGLQAMFLTYGFSAKRTSGYGVAQDTVSNGFFQIRIEEMSAPVSSAPPPAEPQLPKYLQAPGKLKDEYLNPDGGFRERNQAELARMTKTQKQEYEKAKRWWEREGQTLAEQPPTPAEPEAAPPAPQWLRREFTSFGQLREKTNEAAQAIQMGGAQ